MKWGAVSKTVWHVSRIGFEALRLPWLRLKIEGREHLPAQPFVLACSHSSNLDAPLLGWHLDGRYVAFLAKRSLFDSPFGWWYRSVHAIPVDPTGRDAVLNEVAMAKAVDVLRAGYVVGVFPQGTRSQRVGPGRPGAAKLAWAAAVPIVPAAIHGTWDSLPPGRKLPRRARVTIRYGEPFEPWREAGDSAVEQTELIMYRICKLLPNPGSQLPDDPRQVCGRFAALLGPASDQIAHLDS